MKYLYPILIAWCLCQPFASLCQTKDSLDTTPKAKPKPEKPFNGTVVSNPAIKTVEVTLEGVPLSYPVLFFKSEQKIGVSFDELSLTSRSYSYKIFHCNAQWKPSNLMFQEYCKGIEYVPITDYNSSHNTMVDYIHYHFAVPNDDCELLVSGNYMVRIYNDSDKTTPVIETRFSVVENIVQMQALAKPSILAEYKDRYQDVNLTVNLNKLKVRDPYQDIIVVVCQNGRWDNAIRDVKPTFVNNDELTYPQDGSMTFEGGNEFRQFSTKSFKTYGEGIKGISHNGKNFVVTLNPEDPRQFLQYFSKGDLNGKEMISYDGDDDITTNADYTNVIFQLKYDAPETAGEIHLVGALTNWNVTADSKMEYDTEKHAYTKTLLLKQGYYNYEYALYDSTKQTIDCSYLENNHHETENDYLIYVYFADIISGYDRLVGYRFINSIRK